MIRLGVPTGRLWPHSRDLLRGLGFVVENHPRRYVFHRPACDIEALALKVPDLPAAIGDGLVDFAVGSDEWIAEHGCTCLPLMPLCWYHVRICLLAPTDRTCAGDGPVSVATPYPRLTERLVPEAGTIRTVAGSAEVYPGRLTDLAVDCVETGTTAAANQLQKVRELLRCDVRLIARPGTDLTDPIALQIIAAAHATSADPDCCYATAARPV
ncbi:MAG: phosphoribosyltransferase [Nocardia sp.]|uniref:ATP phosphoribosyltransferase n=1 Tax=Nocardia sp. TaxID=1821 RepID=UPI0026254707|nr:ATP phosphoribosyltransferase [Nocardia sp.]MCU1644042.1 phosphoribosyltransferase [Nocardia sp.]